MGHKYVDLGLPSGTKWATTNIGSNSPTQIGSYYEFDSNRATNVWGGNWRIPTRNECIELINNCNIEDFGTYVKYTGPNGKSITIPTSGYKFNGNILNASRACFWTSEMEDGTFAYHCLGISVNSIYYWCESQVRPVI